MRATSLDANCDPCGTTASLGVPGRSNREPAIATQRSGGSTQPDRVEALIAFSASGGTPDVFVVRWRNHVGGAAQSLRAGCPGGGIVRVAGRFAHGQTITVQTVNASRLATLAVLKIGFAGQNSVLRCGVCNYMIGAPITFAAAISNGQTRPFALPLPCDPFFNKFYLDIQFWLANAPSACGIAPGVVASNIVRGTILD